ncbi:MAG: hypothetical protein WBA45_02900 [Microthrixaceae bacterium]
MQEYGPTKVLLRVVRVLPAGPLAPCVQLVHRETGIELRDEIPFGRFTRGELRQLQDDAIERLYPELEVLVARALRIPGRSN